MLIPTPPHLSPSGSRPGTARTLTPRCALASLAFAAKRPVTLAGPKWSHPNG